MGGTTRLMIKLVWIGLAGVCGTLLRYRVGKTFEGFLSGAFAVDISGPQFPWGTLLINLLGCIVLAYVREKYVDSEFAKDVVGIGFLGSFTTFSAFSVETVKLWQAGLAQDSQSIPVDAVIYVALSILGGLFAVYLGTMISKFGLRGRSNLLG